MGRDIPSLPNASSGQFSFLNPRHMATRGSTRQSCSGSRLSHPPPSTTVGLTLFPSHQRSPPSLSVSHTYLSHSSSGHPGHAFFPLGSTTTLSPHTHTAVCTTVFLSWRPLAYHPPKHTLSQASLSVPSPNLGPSTVTQPCGQW